MASVAIEMVPPDPLNGLGMVRFESIYMFFLENCTGCKKSACNRLTKQVTQCYRDSIMKMQ
ncbi:MAG: hypothetical protein A4E28_00015 [Methanocella sp. PtaU1.Bin125]|nr:MAG: hypothetical protein A4E28_00015 [Methanocella sp. PtaU1.Bin125]